MITEQDLREAIAECEGQRNPTANTCMKLAAFYTIRDKMYPQEHDHIADVSNMTYSGASSPIPRTVQASYESDTEFMQAVRGLSTDQMLAVLDEIMTTLSVLNPRLYSAAMRKLLEN